ncbi:MAG TPA: hypothetical protein VIY47_08020 [Ignavibacteriaceae bacterium]
MSNTINLNDYNVSYNQFMSWVIENNMDVYGVNAQGGNGSKIYFFQNIEDFTAFTLKFPKRPPLSTMGYKGITSVDTSYYYAPYIPI